ncbi:MAG: FAD-dependent oxidoreductase [Desulfamplus sp.]|nr:FAD-dependent oxidoreductase [Desulfamplus sp.]
MLKKSPAAKAAIVLLIVVLAASFFIFDLHNYLSLAALKSNLTNLKTYHAENPVISSSIYMIIYIAVTSLSLPGAGIMTLAGGAVFGFWKGVIMVSFASTIGATIAFLIARFLFRDFVQNRFKESLKKVNRGVEKEGAFYLFGIRLVPVFPFFIVNVVMGLTTLPTRLFAFTSQAGMLPATIVFINAGQKISEIDSIGGILSPGIIFAFAMLGIFPLIASKVLSAVRHQRVMSAYKKPEKFDYNLVVIGAGSAGLVSSYIAATVKAKVALVEKHKMGGDCLNTGCVPSKALIKSASVMDQVRRAEEFGFKKGEIEFDFAQVMERVHSIIRKVEPHDSVERYSGLGVECIQAEAFIKSPYEVIVTGKNEKKKILTTRNIIIATGAKPVIPDIQGLADIPFFTSDTIWSIRELPCKLLVLGGGPIGCELAQAFSSLGSKVTLVQRGQYLMKREDIEISELIKNRFQAQGITVLTEHQSKMFINEKSLHKLVCNHVKSGKEEIIEFDALLLALGRSPNVKGLGLEKLGIELSRSGTIKTGDFLETSIPNIFCAGDVAGPYQFTHTAAHQSWYAAVNALFGSIKKFRVDYSVIPWATFTNPEVARVGLNESEANARGIKYEVTRYNLDDLDRAIADSETHGFVKVLTAPGKDKILGVTIVGNHASDTIAEFVLAMKHGLGLNKILGTIHIYPTMAEANKYAAGQWKKAHAPEKLLSFVAKFHKWMRN